MNTLLNMFISISILFLFAIVVFLIATTNDRIFNLMSNILSINKFTTNLKILGLVVVLITDVILLICN